MAARVDAYMNSLADTGFFSGAVLVAKGGKVLVEAAYGKADIARGVANSASTQFKLMSISKTFTAVAILQLVQAGKLELEDAVGKHLPSWPAAWRDVTIHQLLEHTSGIANIENEWATEARRGTERGLAVWKQSAASWADKPLVSPPGTRSSYSNFNFVLLALVVESVTGKPYAEFLRASVLEPAGMTKTGFDDGTRRPGLAIGYFRDRVGAPEPSEQDMSIILGAGSLYSTVADLWRFDRALRGETLLAAATKSKMLMPTSVSPKYACGWQVAPVQGRDCVHHSGGANGYVADFLRFPDDDACIVVTSNFAFAPIGRISDDLAAIVFGQDRPLAKKIAASVLDAHAGVYRKPGSVERTLLVRRSGDALLLFDVREDADRCGGDSLVPVADDLFVMPWGEDRLRFAASSDGRAAGVRLESARGAVAFDRVENPSASWLAAVGDYRAEPAAREPIRVTETSGRLTLRSADGWPVELALVPVTDTLAIALYSVDFGTLVRLDRDEKGVARGFRWQRNDGRTVLGVRAAR